MVERRRDPRIPARLRVELQEKSVLETFTANISRGGLFLEAPIQKRLNELVRLRVRLPNRPAPVEIFGKVAWQHQEGDPRGFGVHFLEIDSEDRRGWLAYLAEVSAILAGAQPGASETPGPERRAALRKVASFFVRFRTAERLESFLTRDMSDGGMFLATPVLRNIGDQVQVVVVHPVTAAEFELCAEVTRVNAEAGEAGPKGMALRFCPMTDEQKVALSAFVQTGQAPGPANPC